MKILHVVHTPRFSGAEVLVAGLANEHRALGHSSTVVALNPAEDSFQVVVDEQEAGGTPWVIPATPLARLDRVTFIRRALNKSAADVVFAHSVIPAAYARLASIGRIVPVLHSETNYEERSLWLSEKVLQFNAEGVIAVSEVAKRDYARRFPYPDVAFIQNGVDLKGFAFSSNCRTRIRESLGIPQSDFVALQVGRIDRIKRQHLSLLAMAEVVRSGLQAHMVFAGIHEDADYLGELSTLAIKLGVSAHVHVLGARKDIPSLLSAADAYVMPSLREAQGIALVEALAAGIPIIGSDICAFRYARDMDAVTLLDPTDISTYSRTLITLADAGSRRVHRSIGGHSIEGTASAYLQFARDCFKGALL